MIFTEHEREEERLIFRRPWKAPISWFVRLLPSQPAGQIYIDPSLVEHHLGRSRYLVALPILLIVIALVYLQITFLSWTGVSGLLAIALAIDLITPYWLAGVASLALFFYYLVASDRGESQLSGYKRYKSKGVLPRLALWEEQTFREGAENWSLPKRLWSCLLFGTAHLSAFIFPLAAAIPLSIGGGFFMVIYLRMLRRSGSKERAVCLAAATHAAYNRIVLLVLLPLFVVVTIIEAIL